MRILTAIMAAGLFAAAPLVANEVEQIASAKALEAITANTGPKVVYDTFNRFCKANFGAKTEPLVRETFGKQLKIEEGSLWVHASDRSASIGWMTNLPATVRISGANAEAATGERPFYVHLWRLKGLTPGKAVQVKLTCTDEFGSTVSRTVKVEPSRPAGAVDFPGNIKGAPYVISTPGHYILTKDITAKRLAILVEAEGVTLDLGGHTVTYGTEKLAKEHFTDKWMSYVRTGSFGIKNMSGSRFKLLNGKVIQGAGDNRGNDESCGFNALYIRSTTDVEVAGVEVDFWSPQNVGVRFRNSGDNHLIHHCVVRDRGTKMHNRHGAGCGTISFIGTKGSNYHARYNLVARTRQNGIRGPYEESHHNEIYVDSWSTNSFATGGKYIHHNRLLSTGYHAIACPWGDGLKVHDNFIHMEGINTGKTRWWEGFGDQNSMNGLRHTQYSGKKSKSTNSEYFRNVVIIRGRHGCQGRGAEFFSDPYIKGLTVRDTTFKVIALDKKTDRLTCVSTHGSSRLEKTQNPITYEDCTFISNISLIRFADYYGQGSHHHFYRSTFRRVGDDSRFNTFEAKGGYWSRYHRFIDTVFEKGTGPEDVDWGPTKGDSRNYTVEWTLTVNTKPKAEVVITDATGKEAFRGKADARGLARAVLVQFRNSNIPAKTVFTPHTVKAAGSTRTVTMDSTKSMTIK